MEVGGTFSAHQSPVWSLSKIRSHGYKVVVAIIVFIISLQFSIQFASYNNRFINLNNFMMPQTMPYKDARRYNFSNPLDPVVSRIFDPKVIFVDAVNDSTTTSNDSSLLPPCPLVPPKLVGRVKVLIDEVPSTMEEVELSLPNIKPGGTFAPTDCKSSHKVAIIIPYRNRPDHLRILLYNIHPILSRQNIDYGIFVIEEVNMHLYSCHRSF